MGKSQLVGTNRQVKAHPTNNVVTGTDLEGRKRTLERSQPYQLSLFQHLFPNEEKYSNSIELYDAVPKYYASTQKMAEMRIEGQYLPNLERSFRHREEEYLVEVKPGRVKTAKGVKEFYPTDREQNVEEALRKIAHDKMNGYYLDNMLGVQFTLYELRKELKKRGHSINYPALIESLSICNQSSISISTADGKSVMSSSIFPTLLICSRDNWEKNPKEAKCYVQFNALVSASLQSLKYRQFDYARFMSFKKVLSKWLFKRLSHNYTHAKLENTYTIKATTIINDSGLVNSGLFRQQVGAIDDAMEELVSQNVLRRFDKKPDYLKRQLIEAMYELSPSYEFVQEAISANQRRIKLTQQAASEGKLIQQSQDNGAILTIAN